MPIWLRGSGATFVAALIVFWIGYGFAWYTISGHHKAAISDIEKQHAEDLATAYQETDEANKRLSALAQEHKTELEEAKHANELLMDAVRRDSVRLLVKADCRLPGGTGSGGVSIAPQVELTKDARQDYHALIDAITEDERVIAYLQKYARRCKNRSSQ